MREIFKKIKEKINKFHEVEINTVKPSDEEINKITSKISSEALSIKLSLLPLNVPSIAPLNFDLSPNLLNFQYSSFGSILGISKNMLPNEDIGITTILPKEVWIMIVSLMDLQSSVLSTMVCKLFYNIVHSDDKMLNELGEFKRNKPLRDFMKNDPNLFNNKIFKSSFLTPFRQDPQLANLLSSTVIENPGEKGFTMQNG